MQINYKSNKVIIVVITRQTKVYVQFHIHTLFANQSPKNNKQHTLDCRVIGKVQIHKKEEMERDQSTTDGQLLTAPGCTRDQYANL